MVAIKAGFVLCKTQVFIKPRHYAFGVGYHLPVDFEHARRHFANEVAKGDREVLFEVLFMLLIPQFRVVFVIEIQKVKRPLRKRCHQFSKSAARVFCTMLRIAS